MHGLLMREQLDDFFRSEGFEPRYRCEVALQLAAHLAVDGAGLTVADALTTIGLSAEGVAFRPIEPNRWMSFGLMFQKDGEPPAEAQLLIAALERRVADLIAAAQDDFQAP